ncbi:MAG: DUF4097 family beta strand repeat-containing protein [Candidatus Acidiferrum sp.]
MNLLTYRTLSIRLGLFLTSFMLIVLCLAPRGTAEEWTKSYAIATRAQVRVSADDASVRITTGDTRQVDIRVEYTGYKLGRDLHVEGRQDGDRVEFTARSTSHWNFSWGKNSHSVRVEIHMPKNADLQVETGDGSVETDALLGKVDIKTGDGYITVNGVKGDIRLRTGDGHIEGRDLDGNLEATSGDGHMSISGRFDSLNLRTGDGSINAHAQNGSKIASGWNVHTGDGSVDLVVPGDLQANIDASTNDGHISMGIPVTVEGSFSTSQIHGKMNGGGQSLSIHTGDGSIRISKS